jgi:predicted translin family RNA/ssDNA-binding protein
MSDKSIAIREEIKNQNLQILNSDNFPIQVQEGIKNILNIVNNNQTLPDLYAKELQEIPFSTSVFQDLCVQMEDHHTPHRKLRQVMLELGGKLDALDAAKNGHKKAIVKIEKLNNEIEELEDIYNELLADNSNLTYVTALRLSSINYQTKDGETSTNHEIINQSIIQSITTSVSISDPKFIKLICQKIKIALATKYIDLEECKRNYKSSEHLIKDAAIKAAQLQNQVEQYNADIKASGLSYEESEFIYYTMYFTTDAEKQLRTGDHQIDRGTYGAVGQLPEPIRKKVLKNINWLQTKIHNDYETSGTWYREDFYVKTHRDLFIPTRTGEGEIEGLNVEEYIKMTPIKVLSDVLMLEGQK